MLTLSLGVLCVALALGLVYSYMKGLRLKEFQGLFETSEQEYKAAQGKIQSLLTAESQQGRLMERGLQYLEALKKSYLEMSQSYKKITEENVGLRQTLEFEQAQYGKLLGQKKSSEVRTGKIAEQMSPFLKDYPLSPATAKFIGDPIDFVHFDEEGVTFVEVKSGKSQLSKKQRHIRDLIKSGKVRFTIYRIVGNEPDKS